MCSTYRPAVAAAGRFGYTRRMSAKVSLSAIKQARDRIEKSIARTPCEFSVGLSEMFGGRVFVKLDNLQATGAFKERGAANKLIQLTDAERKRGVVTASAGNHGLGIAYQARKLGITATVVMPRNAPLVKRANIERLGGKVLLHGDTFDDATAHGRTLDGVYVHGFDDLDIIAGQGTLGLEIIEAVPDLDVIIVPVGGGGLIAGIATAVKAIRPAAKVIGVEPACYASMAAALKAGRPVAIDATPTIADGLAVRRVGALPLEVAGPLIDELVTVTEGEIAQAILMLLEMEKTVVEGAAATTLASLLAGKVKVAGKIIALPLCGGNIDMTMMANIIERGLAKDGRLVSVRTFVSDKPGSLAAVARIIADAGASVKQVHHNRAFGQVEPGGVEVEWILETRGHEHIAELLAKLREKKVNATSG
jgi:threonine dehydratase